MAYEIAWTPKAINSYKKNIKFLADNWSEKVVEDFINKTDKQIALISDYPYVAIATPNSKKFRKLLIVKQITCFYSVSEDKNRITIHLFWNIMPQTKEAKNIISFYNSPTHQFNN